MLIWVLGNLPSGLTRRRPRPVKIKEELITPDVNEENHAQPEEMDTSEDKSSSGGKSFALLLSVDHFNH